MFTRHTLLATSTLAMTLLAGCGSDSDGNATTTPPQSQQATFSLAVSDAPVTNLKAVWVAFDAITLKAQGGNSVTFDLKSEDGSQSVRMVNLLDYTGDDIYQLLADQNIPPGSYEWLRADVVNGDSSNYTLTSHVVYNDETMAPLVVSRKGNDGIGEIQMNSFSLLAGDNQFVLEFDLKKSLVDPKNNDEIKLKPTGVRLENLAQKTKVSGDISAQLMADCEVANATLAGLDNRFEHAVYLYSATVETPADIYTEGEQQSATSPLATSLVSIDADDQQGEYEIAFLSTGDYKVTYTCLAHLDNIETQDADFTLYRTQSVTLTGTENDVDFTE
ncbi:DUF4382 domain-containing protein [Pseudoalteromonas fenneropenaei]|uniref:DUF4382 domain-containing protein n=1 Tax=Pseudoalteromonas fenneropenaei TaxID=1737459 RepID=A0ABV7CJT8_9GAMM